MASGVAEGDQGPSVSIVVHLHHLAHVRFLQTARGDAFAAHSLWQQVEERPKHCSFHLVVVSPARQLHGEDQVQVVVRLRLGRQYVRSSASVQPDVAYPHPGASVTGVGLQFAAHYGHQIPESNLQRREVPSSVDADHLVHHVVQPTHLLETKHRQPLLRIWTVRVVAAAAVALVTSDAIGLAAVHLAEGLHHSDPTLAFLADLQGATHEEVLDVVERPRNYSLLQGSIVISESSE